MIRSLILLLIILLPFSCTGDLDKANYPPDQYAVMMAFKRVKDHGQIEPVLVEGQTFEDWQFRVEAGDGAQVPRLVDGSGIGYEVDWAASDFAGDRPAVGAVVLANGEVISVRRDYPAGVVVGVLMLHRVRLVGG